MGSQIVRGKKKGRPSKADLAARRRAAEEEEDEHPRRSHHDYNHHLQGHHKRRRRWSEYEETEEQRDLRRSLRRRSAVRYNLIDYDEDYWEGEDDDFLFPQEEEDEQEETSEDEEDEDERREKKLKLVVKLPNRMTSTSTSGRADSCGGFFNGGHIATRRFGYGEDIEDEDERAEGEDGAEEEEETKGEEKIQVFKKRKVIKGGDIDDDDNYEEEEDNEDRSRREEEESNLKDSSVLGIPNEVPARTPMPEKKQLELILDKLQKKDTYGVYAEPVDPDELPDYHDIIEHPMDFGTVRKQLADGEYSTLEQLESDVYLICFNAMQYNAPETIYHKQARAIKELAEKKFQRARARMDQVVIEKKPEQQTKSSPEEKPKPSPIVIKKQARKPHTRNIQEHVDSDFAGATLATGDVHNTTASAAQTTNCDRPSNIEVPMEGISALADSNIEKAEDLLQLGKGQGAKLGRKVSIVDENRRETYDVSNQPLDRSDLVLAAFEDEQKLLIPVGLYGDHSYALSLARFAATLGPTAWKMASERIEQFLPPGLEFGRGWVGEFEPVSTQLLYTAKEASKTNPFVQDLQNSTHPVTSDKHLATVIASKEFQADERILNAKSSFSSYSCRRDPASPPCAAVQQQFAFLGKLPHVAVPMKRSSECIMPVAATNDECVKDKLTASDAGSGGTQLDVTLFGASHLQQNAFIQRLWNGSTSSSEGPHNLVQKPIPSRECLDSGQMLQCKPSLRPDSRGSQYSQPVFCPDSRTATPSNGISNKRNPFSRSYSSGPENMFVNGMKVVTPSAYTTNQNSDNSQQKQLRCGAETATARNLNFLQSIPYRMTSSPSNNGGEAISGVVFPDEKKNTRKNVSVDINQPASSSSSGASPSHSIGMTTKMAFPPKQDHQGLSDPVQVMKNLAHNAQNSHNDNYRVNCSITTTQIGPSAPSPRGGGSNMGGPASQAAGIWMHVGSKGVKEPSSDTSNEHTRSPMPAGSLSYNRNREVHHPQFSQPHTVREVRHPQIREVHHPQMSLPHTIGEVYHPQISHELPLSETNLSARMHFESEKMNYLPFQAFIPQHVSRPSSTEAHVQQQRQRPAMLFPQLMMNDPSRVQHNMQSSSHHWRGINRQTSAQQQKQDNLKPDLNIAFQSTVDSQQPDLALQL